MIFFPSESLVYILGFFALLCLYGYYNFMEIASEQIDIVHRNDWLKRAAICRRWSIIFMIFSIACGISASFIPAY